MEGKLGATKSRLCDPQPGPETPARVNAPTPPDARKGAGSKHRQGLRGLFL